MTTQAVAATRTVKREEARVVLQRISLPPDMFIHSKNEDEDEDEEVDVVGVSEEENKENDGGNTIEARVKGKSSKELPIESNSGGGGDSSIKVIIVNEETEEDDDEVSFKGGKNSGWVCAVRQRE